MDAINFDITKNNEIVAANINGVITNSRATIAYALDAGLNIEWLSRARMQLMASCDLGEKWRALATGPTLFVFDENGVPHHA